MSAQPGPLPLDWTPALGTGDDALDTPRRTMLALMATLEAHLLSDQPIAVVDKNRDALRQAMADHMGREEARWAQPDADHAGRAAQRQAHRALADAQAALEAEASSGLRDHGQLALSELALALRFFIDHVVGAGHPAAEPAAREAALASLRARLLELEGTLDRARPLVTQLSVIIDTMSDGFGVAEQSSGRILLANPALCRLLGRSSEALRQLTFREVTVPRALAQAESAFKRSPSQGAGLGLLRTQLLDAQGNEHTVDISNAVVEDRPAHHLQVAVFRDVQAQVEQADAQRSAARRFQALLAGLPGAVMAIDRLSHRVVLVNPAFGQLCRCDPRELVGQHMTALHPAEALPRVAQVVSRVARGVHSGPVRDLPLRRKDGEVVLVDVSCTLLNQDGRSLILGLFTESRGQRGRPAAALDGPWAGTHDPVSGLLTTEGFVAEVEARLRAEPGVAWLMLRFDLDHFRTRTAGVPDHGSAYLRALARRLEAAPSVVTAARLVQDEFIALVERAPGQEAEAQAQALLAELLDTPLEAQHGPLRFDATGAVCEVVDPDTLVGATVRHLRVALDDTRLNAGARLVAVREAPTGRARSRHDEVRHGLDHGELEVWFQPQARLDRDEVVGYEALLRWRHPTRGVQTLPQILDRGVPGPLRKRLGHTLLSQALDQLARWHASGLAVQVAVNVDGAALAAPTFVDELAAELARRPALDPRRLQLEVLESSALEPGGALQVNLHRLAELGVSLAIDHFGTGYASLSLLQALPIAAVKIDESFVGALMHDVRQAAIVDSVLGMARALLRAAVAQGVDDVVLGTRLIQLGARAGQGLAIAPAMPADQVLEWAASWRRPEAWRRTRTVPRARVHALLLGWDHQAWRLRVLQRIAAPPPRAWPTPCRSA